MIDCLEYFDLKTFFADAPWLSIPTSRQAHIIKEPLRLPTGLLGGSAKGEKMSKLAALAAKRRQKENVQPVQVGGESQPTVDDFASSLKALRLSSPALFKRKLSDITGKDQFNTGTTQKPPRHTPVTDSPEKRSPAATLYPQKEDAEFEPKDLKARPSPFASTILGSATPTQPSNLDFVVEQSLLGSQLHGFDFTVPSPDDVVLKAQAAKGPR